MSSSDRPRAEALSNADLDRHVEELTAAANALAADEDRGDLDQAGLARLLAASIRIYANCSVDPYGPSSLAELAVTPTEACTVAAALLRSQSLTPFEFSIWFTGGRVGGGR